MVYHQYSILLALSLALLSNAYFINIDASSEECFFEEVVKDTSLTLTFEVAEGGFLDIDVNVSTL